MSCPPGRAVRPPRGSWPRRKWNCGRCEKSPSALRERARVRADGMTSGSCSAALIAVPALPKGDRDVIAMSAKIRHRNRPRHDQQRAGLYAGGCGPAAAGTAADPATCGHGDGRVADHVAELSLPGRGHEAGGGALDLPWAEGRDFAVGEFARRQGAEMPDRTVAAAKSWLCHSRVDRRQPILPWNAPAEVPKVSPVTASQRYLEHLVAAWEAAHPDAPMAEQHVVLTVPASFDASAREADARGRAGRGAAGRPGAAGRAAGGGLRLAGHHRRALAAGAFGGRHAAGVRRGRRHDRPDAGRRRRGAGRVGAAANRRRQSSAGGRRQHGPGPGPSRGRPVRRKGRAARPLAIGRPVAFVPRGQGNAAGARRPGDAQHLGPRPRAES